MKIFTGANGGNGERPRNTGMCLTQRTRRAQRLLEVYAPDSAVPFVKGLHGFRAVIEVTNGGVYGPEDWWRIWANYLGNRADAQGVKEKEEEECPDEPVGSGTGVGLAWLSFGGGFGHGIGLLGVRRRGDVDAPEVGVP